MCLNVKKKNRTSVVNKGRTGDQVSNPGNYIFSFIQLYMFRCLHTMTSITSIVL